MKSTMQKGLLWYVGIELVVLVCFYLPWLSGMSSYYFRDVTHYVEPFCRFVADSYQHLRLPLWNPWCYCGMPQAAVSVQGIFYPPTWLFVLLPFNAALASSMILHQLLCGLGAFLLVSSFGWGMLSAVLCAITLSLSGYMFSLVPNFTLVCTAAWCPLSLWAIRRIGQDRDQGETAAAVSTREYVMQTAIAAVCVGMLLLAGHPELASFNLMLVGGFVVGRAVKGGRANDDNWREILEWRIKALGLAILIAMPAILPAYEWFGLSRRSTGLLAAESLLLSANWYDLLNLILPQPLGDLQLRYAQFRPLVMDGQMVPYVPAAFVGPVVITLALWGISDRTFKYRWLVLALMLLMIGLALGSNAPFAPALLAVLPKLSIIRFPVKLLFFVVWSLGLLAARGLYSVCKGPVAVTIPLIFWSIFSVGAGLILAGANWADPIVHFAGMNPAMQQLWHLGESLLAKSALIAGVIGILVTLVGYFYVSKRPRQAIAAGITMIALAAASMLYYATIFCHHGGAPRFFQQPSFVAQELNRLRTGTGSNQANRSIGLYLERFTVPSSYVGSDPALATEKMYQYSRELLRPNTNIDFNEPSSFGFEGTSTNDYYYFLINCYLKSSQAVNQSAQNTNDDALARFCQLTATKYVLTQCYRFGNDGKMVPIAALDSRFFKIASVSNEMNVRIYELNETLPRAYFASRWIWSKSRDATLEAMFNPSRSLFNPVKTTVLERPDTASDNDLKRPETGGLIMNSTVNIDSETEQEVSLSVHAGAAGLVVLADQDYPGWCAEVDGKPADILTANCFTRAVQVREGAHTVRFFYRPMSVWAGLALSLVAIIWLVCLMAFSGRRSQAST